MPPGKSKTMPMQIFLGVEAMYYGIVQVENWEITGGRVQVRAWERLGNFLDHIMSFITPHDTIP